MAEATRLLQAGEIVVIAPGGMREAMRGPQEKYRVSWESRDGFVRLALRAQVPIVLAACPRADDIYSVISLPFSRWAYRRLHVPAQIPVGRWMTPIPRPVCLRHPLSTPTPATRGRS